MNANRFNFRWMGLAVVMVLMMVGLAMADGGRDNRYRKDRHGYHHTPHRPPVHHHYVPAPPPPPPPRVYVPVYPVVPPPRPYYGGSLFSASVGVPGLSIGLSIGGW